ncbi:MAG: exodeoxyribonuclease VII small subunit [Chromatiales bacterium]
MAKKNNDKDTPDFESALQRLESLVESMEHDELTLEQSLAAFEQGIRLTRICQEALKRAEQKVEMLSGDSENAELEPFNREL